MTSAIDRRTATAAIAALATAAGIGFAGPTAQAQPAAYPAKPITFVVPFPPGGTTDIIGRVVAAHVSTTLGVPVVVENKAGANGNIGSTAVARAAPDGYTLLVTGIGSNAVNHGLYKDMPYDSRTSFAHITQLTAGPNVLTVNKDFPAQTFKEFIEVVKKDPGKYNYASSGNGASGHMAMELLKTTAGLKIDHIPYKGGNPAFTDVMSGQVHFMFINQDLPIQHMKAGRVRVLAVASLEPNPAYPGVPTVAENGFPGFSAVSWNGLAAPAGTPKDIVDKIYAAVVKALEDPAIKGKMLEQGFVPGGMSPADMSKFIDAEITKWTKVAQDAGAKVD